MWGSASKKERLAGLQGIAGAGARESGLEPIEGRVLNPIAWIIRIRRVLQEKMPKLLSPGVVAGSSETPPAQSIREKLKAMTADNWPQIRDEVLAMLSRSAA